MVDMVDETKGSLTDGMRSGWDDSKHHQGNAV